MTLLDIIGILRDLLEHFWVIQNTFLMGASPAVDRNLGNNSGACHKIRNPGGEKQGDLLVALSCYTTQRDALEGGGGDCWDRQQQQHSSAVPVHRKEGGRSNNSTRQGKIYPTLYYFHNNHDTLICLCSVAFAPVKAAPSSNLISPVKYLRPSCHLNRMLPEVIFAVTQLARLQSITVMTDSAKHWPNRKMTELAQL